MMIYEEDAGGYHCPFSKGRREWGDAPEGSSFCLGEDCMAWRWARVRNPDWNPQHPMVMMTPQPHPDDVPSPWIKSESRGYCGLAGEP